MSWERPNLLPIWEAQVVINYFYLIASNLNAFHLLVWRLFQRRTGMFADELNGRQLIIEQTCLNVGRNRYVYIIG